MSGAARSNSGSPILVNPGFAPEVIWSHYRGYTWVVADRIVKIPGVCGGKACIAGHRIRVLDVVESYEHQGMSPEDIVVQFPSITLADVHAALAYYHDHLDEIRRDARSEEAALDEAMLTNPSRVLAKLRTDRQKEKVR
jgi:uncharacterized protein (DUF433 family)